MNWTTREEMFLMDSQFEISVQEIAEILERTVRAVKHKKTRLNNQAAKKKEMQMVFCKGQRKRVGRFLMEFDGVHWKQVQPTTILQFNGWHWIQLKSVS